MTGTSIRVLRDAPLRALNTFGIDAYARTLVEVDDLGELPSAMARHDTPDLLLLGSGSNVLFVQAPDTVMRFTDARIDVEDGPGDSVRVRCAAGHDWHAFVMHTLANDWYGLENLALIPGTVGASPVQNIGAYGVEIMDRIESVSAWDRLTGTAVTFLHDACQFSYRDSRFKHSPDRWLITHVTFNLSRRPNLVLEYAGVRDALTRAGIHAPTPQDVSRAVISERQRKLPDPAMIGNAGSFFKNPIVPYSQANAMSERHPDMPVNPAGLTGMCKLSAAWLIEQAGMKGYREGDAAVSDRHALVLVNHGHASGNAILEVARRVAEAVQAKFGIPIQPEPRIVGARW